MLPDAERLCGALAESLRPGLPPDTALVGIHTGGVWVAQRLLARYEQLWRDRVDRMSALIEETWEDHRT